MTEKTIAKFKYEKSTFKLLEITYKETTSTQYLIVRNRKRLTWSMWEGVAKQKFANLIAGELLQTKLQL